MALATVSGVIFPGHEFGGFTGAWPGGAILGRTGSRDRMWSVAIAVATFAALVSLSVRDRMTTLPAPATSG